MLGLPGEKPAPKHEFATLDDENRYLRGER